ncbi:hypothetical protein [Candidatus Nardonella dryophthoridicola]|uniref:hypothetical protein n=1 Tax=Candidatus Nardonella dryophthoridicola TaxID=1971485 RepID=UPI003B97159E
MSRRNIKLNNKIYPDIKYNSILISKFINILMKNGKKLTSKFIVYKSLELAIRN